MNWIHYTVFAMVFYAIGEYFSKDYTLTQSMFSYNISWISYMVVIAFWYPALSGKESIALLNIVWSVSYALIGVMLGIFVFKEVLTPCQYVGIVFAIVGIVLIS